MSALRNLGLALILLAPGASAAGPPGAKDEQQAELRECRRNLRLIGEAILAYRTVTKDVPKELDDLVPRYLAETRFLTCPTARRLGVTSGDASGVGNRERLESASSYEYEFKDKPVPEIISGGSSQTMREWKRLQMTVVGSEVPIVRCHCHVPISVNLSFGGRLYESISDWERYFSATVNFEDLTFARLFAQRTVRRIVFIPERDAHTSERLIDLSDYYNAELDRSWMKDDPSPCLAALTVGPNELAGVQYDVRGIVQLRGEGHGQNFFPMTASIKVDLPGTVIHILHGTIGVVPPGTITASCQVLLADGRTSIFQVHYGHDVSDWRSNQEISTEEAKAVAPSSFDTKNSNAQLNPACLYHIAWNNPWPSARIQSVDFSSAMTSSAPFLVAITVQPAEDAPGQSKDDPTSRR